MFLLNKNETLLGQNPPSHSEPNEIDNNPRFVMKNHYE